MISAFFLLYILLKDEDRMIRFIKAGIAWTLYCFAVTELLSVFQGICTRNLWLCWGGFDAVLLGMNLLMCRNSDCKLKIKETADSLRKQLTWKMGAWFIFALGMIIMAIKTVPYNWDSMTYHLARVFHWHQNGTVAHYATYIERQVASPVLGAFVELHIYTMLNGHDTFVNLMQCISFLFNGILVFHITKKLKCADTWCYLASVLFYTTPIAFAESLTTQVDNFAAFWMLSFAYLLFEMLDLQKKMLLDKKTALLVVNLTFCIAFGYLAKPSVCIEMVLFAAWLLMIVVLRKDNWRTLLLYFLSACGTLVLILAPESVRNIITFEALASSATGQRQLIGTLHPLYVLVNGIKNFTFNLPAIWIYNSRELFYKIVSKISVILRVDINNPAIAEDGREFMVRNAQNFGHDTAVNPVISWFFLACIIFFIFKNRKKSLKELKNQYFLVSGVSFLIFCMLLRWEPFVSRYMISYFAVLCPAVCAQAELFFKEKGDTLDKGNWYKAKWIFGAILGFVCVTEFTGMLYFHADIIKNQGEIDGYFTNRGEIKEAYNEIATVLNDGGYKKIGLIIGGDSYEYPLTVMLEDYERLEHVNVRNATGGYEDVSYVPEVIAVLGWNISGNVLECHGYEYEMYKIVDDENAVFVLKKEA